VAEILAVCESPEVIGAPFYVMEEMRGEVVTTAMPAGLDTPEQRRRTGEQLVDALVELHAVDWRAAGLEGFGKPEGYLERQLRRFLGLWEHNKTREIPAVESVGTWLRDHLPQSPPSTIVHGDYRLGNVMLAAAPPAEVVAIFDWEMSTIGDPLADLGYLCLTYASRDDGDDQPFQLSKVTLDEGWPLRDELIARYEERSGRSMTDIRWYQTLALWKAIVFMEGNFKRASSGMSDDPYLKSFGDTIVEMAERAEGLTREA
jgi:aminoglycoside phosphotransferase (APT) family kinase protein